MSEKRVKVEREVAEREIKVERENINFVNNELNITGVFPSGTKEITENGEYDVELFKKANVAVPPDAEEFYVSEIPSSTSTNAKSFLKRIEIHSLNPAATGLASFMQSCANLEYADFSGCDTSRITSFSYAFGHCPKLKYIDISGWTNANANSADYMFYSCTSLETLVINSPTRFATGGHAFNGAARGINVYVPDALVDEYKTAWAAWITNLGLNVLPLSELPANTGA